MGRPKGSKNKRKVKELNKADGELIDNSKSPLVNDKDNPNPKSLPKYKNLAEIMGEEETPLNQADYEKFCNTLNNMNTAEIQELCPDYGLLPIDSRSKMIERLQREWKKKNKKMFDFQNAAVKIDEKLVKQVKDILSVSK